MGRRTVPTPGPPGRDHASRPGRRRGTAVESGRGRLDGTPLRRGAGPLGAPHHAADRRRPHRAAGPGLRVPHPGPLGLLGAHRRAHHLAARRRRQHVGEPVGPVVGRGHARPTCCAVDFDANVVEGKWDVTPAIHIHTELHKRRHDARIVVHNHPYHVSLLAAIGELPEIVHQTGSMFDGELRVRRRVHRRGRQPRARRRPGRARSATRRSIVLANHGVIVTGETIAEATFRAACIDRMCRLAYDAMLARHSRPRRSRRASEGDEGVAARARLATCTGTAPCACSLQRRAGGARVAMAKLDDLARRHRASRPRRPRRHGHVPARARARGRGGTP